MAIILSSSHTNFLYARINTSVDFLDVTIRLMCIADELMNPHSFVNFHHTLHFMTYQYHAHKLLILVVHFAGFAPFSAAECRLLISDNCPSSSPTQLLCSNCNLRVDCCIDFFYPGRILDFSLQTLS